MRAVPIVEIENSQYLCNDIFNCSIKRKFCRKMQIAIVNRAESENLNRCICTNIAKNIEVCANGLIIEK